MRLREERPHVSEVRGSNSYKFYNDETCELYLDEYKGLLCLAAQLRDPRNHLRHYRRLMDAIVFKLKSHGYSSLHCLVSDKKRERFAQFVGFKDTEVTSPEGMKIMKMCF